MQVTVNGKVQDLPGDIAVSQLLEMLKVQRDGVAIEVNRALVPRSRHAETRLKEGDAVEIVTFVGGG